MRQPFVVLKMGEFFRHVGILPIRSSIRYDTTGFAQGTTGERKNRRSDDPEIKGHTLKELQRRLMPAGR